MNFKDAYNSMTDEIHGNRVLLHSILNGETKKKKIFAFSVKPVFGTALAAMLVLTASALYFRTGINDYSLTEENGIMVADFDDNENNRPSAHISDQLSDESDALSDQSQNDNYNTGKSTTAPKSSSSAFAFNKAVLSEDNKATSGDRKSVGEVVIPSISASQSQVEADKAEVQTENSYHLDKSVSARTAQQEAKIASDLPKTASICEADNAEPVTSDQQLSVSGGSASGAGDMAVSELRENERNEYLTTSQYWEYIGEDLSQKTELPDGYSLTVPAGVDMAFEGDKVVSDVFTMTASSSSGDIVVIAVSKQTSLGSLYPEAAHSSFGDVNVAVVSEGLSDEQVDHILSSVSD